MATTVQTRAPALLNELLRGAERLSAPQLDAFVCRVVALRAQRFAPSLPRDEADLLTKVSRAPLKTACCSPVMPTPLSRA